MSLGESKSEVVGSLSQKTQKFYKLTLYTRIYLGIGSAFLVYGLSVLPGFEFTAILGVAVFASMFAVYAMNRKSDIQEDEANLEFGGAKLAERTYRLGVLCLLISVIAAFLINVYVLTAVLIFLGMLSAYSFRLLPSFLPYQRLKEIPFVKNIVVGSGVALVFIVGALVQEPLTLSLLVLGMFVFLALRVLIGSVIPDIRDIEGDKKAGVKTVPVIYGVTWTKNFLLLVNLIATVIYFWMIYANYLPFEAVLAGLVNFPTFLLIIKTNEENADKLTLVSEMNTCFTLPILLIAGFLLMT